MRKIIISKKLISKDADDLFRAILRLKKIDGARRFFRDLLTEKEIAEFSQRWKIAKMLSSGRTYAEIEEATSISSATIARIQRWLKTGAGGYKSMIKNENKKI